MAYCVHCGVKLGYAERVCPLCGTIVYDPAGIQTVNEKNWPDSIDFFQRKKVNWPFLSRMIILLLIVLAFISLLSDVIVTHQFGWSLYATAGCVLIAAIVAIPATRKSALRILFLFAGSTFALIILAYITNGFRWLLYLALPFTAIFFCYIALCVWLIRKKKLRLAYRVVFCLLTLIISLVVIEMLIGLYEGKPICIYWSAYAVIPLLVTVAFFTVAAHNRRLVEYIKKNSFVSPE